MYRKYIGLITLLCCLTVNLLAQSSTTEKVSKKSCSCGFSSINQAGVMSGENGNSLMAQTINGFRYKTWFVGAGIGLDGYHTLTAPLFLDIRKSLLAKTNTPFLYADGGIQLIDKKQRDKLGMVNNYDTGPYYDFGVGYQIGLKDKHALLMSAGYSSKRLDYSQATEFVCITFPCPNYVNTYKYELNRLTLKVGYRF